MNRVKRFIKDEGGMGVVEVILIIVVLIWIIPQQQNRNIVIMLKVEYMTVCYMTGVKYVAFQNLRKKMKQKKNNRFS